MRSILTLIISLSLLTPASGQNQWEIVNEGFVCTVSSVDFINEDIGWIAGKEGIFKTTNGSQNWLKLNSDHSFYVIDFHDESIGWAIIYGGRIMKTSDGGRNWLLQKKVKGSINELHAITENVVYAIGYRILKTGDGGSRWEDISPSEGSDFRSACFINADTGIVIGNGRIIFKTIDGGKSWEKNEIPEFSEIYNLQFTIDSLAYFNARKSNDSIIYICKTTNFFSNWTILSETDLPIQSCHFFNNDVVVGISIDNEWREQGTANNLIHICMVKSNDGGSTWNYPDSFIPLTYGSWLLSGGSYRVHFIGNLGYYFASRDADRPLDFIIKSEDQGNTWSCSNISQQLNDVQFLDTNTGFVLGGNYGFHYGYGVLFKTEDGGKTWNMIYYDDFGGRPAILFSNESIGFMTSNNIRPSGLFTSSNGGYSWTKDTILTSVADFCLANDSTAWAVDLTGTEYLGVIYYTNMGENKWNFFHEIGTLGYPSSICFLDEKTGWVVGPISTGSDNYKNLILKYTEEQGWSNIPNEVDLPVTGMRFIDNEIGWISGGYGNNDGFRPIFLRSSDGGENWDQIPGLNYLISDFYFENKDHGWAVGENDQEKGTILETFNGGFAWEVVTDTLPSPLNSLCFTDSYGWAVGGRWERPGLLLKYVLSDTSDQEYAPIRNEHHFQNHPNPFHSRTMISYSLSASSDVELNIFDLSGREVITLVNETQQVGNHEVEWNANGMNPAIYICELKTGQGRQVMKIIKL